MTDVTDIKTAREKKQQNKLDKNEKKHTFADLLMEFDQLMARDFEIVPKEHERWPHRTGVDSNSKEVVIMSESGVASRVRKEVLMAMFRNWTYDIAPRHIKHWNNVGNKTLKECIDHYCNDTKNQVYIPAVVVGTGNEPCWSRVPIDPYADPVLDGDPRIAEFEDFISRCGASGVTVRQWIGSLFDMESDRSQYLWINGEGNDGKSTLIRFLKKIFGPSFVAAMAADHAGDYWIDSIVGKRLVAFPDTNTYEFVTSQTFKTCSGNDPVSARAIYGTPYQASLEAKFMFCSNKLPNISGGKADMRRMILVNLEPFEGVADPSYEVRLEASLPFVVSNCIGHYARFVAESGGRRQIPINNLEEIETLAEENEAELHAVLETFFIVQGVGSLEKLYVSGTHMTRIAQVAFRGDRKRLRSWREFLRRNGIVYKAVRAEKNRAIPVKKMWCGVTTNAVGKRVCERFDESNVPNPEDDAFDMVTNLVTRRDL